MFITIKVLIINKIDGIKGGVELIGKCRKLSKTRKLLKSLKLSKSRNSKDKKLFKSQNLAKLEKKLSKSENSPNFNIKENKPSFLTLNTRIIFNRL